MRPKLACTSSRMKIEVLFPAELLQELQIGLRRMVRAAAAEVGLGDQHAETTTELMDQGVQFAPIGRQVERLAAHGHVGALGHRKGDEADARIAVPVGLAAGDGAGQALLAVEAEARGQDDVAAAVAGQGGPQRLLNPFGTGRGPQHLFHAPAAGPGLHGIEQTPAGFDLERRDGVVGGHRHRIDIIAGARAPVSGPTHQLVESAPASGADCARGWRRALRR